MIAAGRLFSIIIWAIIINVLLIGTSFAGFFDSDENGKSGLDFSGGYDINTVSTMSGQVVALPHSGEKENIIVEIKSNYQTLNVSVGPRTFWEKKGIAIKLNDELSVKGSKAQGNDGQWYVLAQKLVNRTTGGQVTLRSENGKPAWSERNRTESPAGGMMRNGGGMMRNGGGMMRNGGGMMRR